MPKLQANFEKISTEFEAVPPGEYRAVVEEIEESKTRKNQLPQLVIKNKVTEGEFEGRIITDFVTLQTNEGKKNDIGYGRIKAYAIAVNGEEAGNGEEIDTDDFLHGTVTLVVVPDIYEKNGEQVQSSKISKVLPA